VSFLILIILHSYLGLLRHIRLLFSLKHRPSLLDNPAHCLINLQQLFFFLRLHSNCLLPHGLILLPLILNLLFFKLLKILLLSISNVALLDEALHGLRLLPGLLDLPHHLVLFVHQAFHSGLDQLRLLLGLQLLIFGIEQGSLIAQARLLEGSDVRRLVMVPRGLGLHLERT
jgi:hypothetical protein